MSRRMDREGCGAVVFLDFDGVLNDAAHRAVVLADHHALAAWSYDLGVALIDPARESPVVIGRD